MKQIHEVLRVGFEPTDSKSKKYHFRMKAMFYWDRLQCLTRRLINPFFITVVFTSLIPRGVAKFVGKLGTRLRTSQLRCKLHNQTANLEM